MNKIKKTGTIIVILIALFLLIYQIPYHPANAIQNSSVNTQTKDNKIKELTKQALNKVRNLSFDFSLISSSKAPVWNIMIITPTPSLHFENILQRYKDAQHLIIIPPEPLPSYIFTKNTYENEIKIMTTATNQVLMESIDADYFYLPLVRELYRIIAATTQQNTATITPPLFVTFLPEGNLFISVGHNITANEYTALMKKVYLYSLLYAIQQYNVTYIPPLVVGQPLYIANKRITNQPTEHPLLQSFIFYYPHKHSNKMLTILLSPQDKQGIINILHTVYRIYKARKEGGK